MQIEEILNRLRSQSNSEAKAGMSRFGINVESAYGVSIPQLRKMASRIGKNHLLAEQLWSSSIHEARILAGMIEEPEKVTGSQMERWVKDFNSWDLCDQCCSNLFDRTRFAHEKAMEWSGREEEFVKRAGFALMACLAVHDKNATDGEFVKFMPVIKRESEDPRNFVKKAVNWALRQIGKRNLALNSVAIQTAREIQTMDFRSARWIASDALRELTSEKIQKKLCG